LEEGYSFHFQAAPAAVIQAEANPYTLLGRQEEGIAT